MIVKAIARITNYIGSDSGVGIDYDLAVLDSTWREHFDGDDTNYVEFPDDGSIEPQELAFTVANNAAKRVNAGLILAGYPEFATCTPSDVLVPGLSDTKLTPEEPRNIFTGVRTRVRRIPRTQDSYVMMTEAQQTLDSTNKQGYALTLELRFMDQPDLADQLEYRALLFPVPPNISLAEDNYGYVVLDSNEGSGSNYKLTGSINYEDLHPALRLVDENGKSQVHTVLALFRKDTGTAMVPSDAGTIQSGKWAWVKRNEYFPFEPSYIPGLEVWFRPESLASMTDGDLIATWDDVSGANRDGIGAASIYFPTKGTDDLPRATFASDYLDIAWGPLSTDVINVFLVTQPTTAAPSNLYNLIGGGTGAFSLRHWHDNGEPKLLIGKTSSHNTTTTELPLDSLYHIVGASYSATDWMVNVDGGIIEADDHSSGALTSSVNLRLGCTGSGPTPSAPYFGYIREVIITTGILTDELWRMIEGYLAHKHGVPLPEDHPWFIAPPVI